MKRLFQSLFYSAVMTLSISVLADDLGKMDAKSLEDTISLLKSKSQRQQVIDESPDAAKADAMAKNLLGDGADLEGVYSAAANILRSLAASSKGDASDLMKKVSDAQNNPEAFLKSLSPEQQAMIKKLATQAQGRQKKPNP
ncbi:MAG: hypothetical protein AAF203_05210 [Pseudomonadota bacterium]